MKNNVRFSNFSIVVTAAVFVVCAVEVFVLLDYVETLVVFGCILCFALLPALYFWAYSKKAV